MQLSKRLTAVAKMVTQGSVVADVGCDHGYLPIYLMEKKWIPKAIAMDVNRGPLEKAREHIEEYAFSQYIELRLSDGIMALAEGEADTLICAGMGGKLIRKILLQDNSKMKSLKELILQPQSEIGMVRKFLREAGYSIVDENMILEDGKFYSIMRAIPCVAQEKDREEDTKEIFDKYGKFLLLRKNLTLLEYLHIELAKYNSIINDLECNENKTEKQIARTLEIKKEIKEAQEALLYFKER